MRVFFLYLLFFSIFSGCRKKTAKNPFSITSEVPAESTRKVKAKKSPKTSLKRKRRRRSGGITDRFRFTERTFEKNQRKFDRDLERVLHARKQGSRSYALNRVRDLLKQYEQQPVYLMQLHYLEAELKRELAGDRKGLYYDVIEDMKKIRKNGVMDSAVKEGKAASDLIYQVLQKKRKR